MRRRSLPFALSVLLLLSAVPVSAAPPVDLPPAAGGPHDDGPPAEPPAPPVDPSEAPPVDPSEAPPVDPDAAPPVEPPTDLADPSTAPPVDAPVDPPAEGPAAPAGSRAPLDTTGRWIVLLRDGADATRVRDRHADRTALRADRTFVRAIRGFSARLTNAQLAALRADRDVVAVVPDEVVELTAQSIPTGVSRVGARASTSTVAKINGIDERVDADVAIVDTGIDASHPDLNVVGGYNCSTSDRTLWRDVQNHGTHVAGTVGALDNSYGVVGVAPGVRLWAVKILNDEGYGYLSWYICGLDWIAAQRDPADPTQPLIEAVNMSVAKWGTDTPRCGVDDNDLLHQAICRVVSSGVTVVAAAANDSSWASRRVPAAYNEVITVSALADTDGKAGGLGGNRCYSWGTYDRDDTFADFSNYGGDVDLIAPGKCIWSTLPGNRYGYSSGTSMAAPAVTGAAALFKASRPWALPAAVRNSLQILGSTNWYRSTDPDGIHERLLDVSRLGPAGSFSVALTAPPAAGEQGGAVRIPVTINRSSTHFETLRLSAVVPTGFKVAFDQVTLSGFAAKTATLTVTVPAGLPAGSHDVTVVADDGSRRREATTQIAIETDVPIASAPNARPIYRSAISHTYAPLAVSWPAATDASSAIAGYEVQASVDGGAWGSTTSHGAGVRSVVRNGSFGHVHRYRVRARDAAGNWSDWATGPTVDLRTVDDRAATASASWVRYSYAYAYGKSYSRSLASGAWLRMSVAARTVAIVAPTGPRQGWFKIYVNGVYQGQISLYSASGANRRVLWVKTFATGDTKVVELRAVRTSTRYRTDFDALVVVR
jgi:subtilisin family serine protease